MSGPTDGDGGRGPREAYQQRVTRFGGEEATHARRAAWIGNARAVCFVGLIGAGVWAEARPGPLPLLVATALAAAFIVLVVWHGRVRAAERTSRELRELNQQGLDRLDRNWERLPVPGEAPANHPYARDLDLFGTASLGQLLGPAATPAGVEQLRGWLLGQEARSTADAQRTGATAGAIEARQQAIRELAARIELRDEIARLARGAVATTADLDAFFEWAESDRSVVGPALRALAVILPLATAALVALALLDGPDRLWLLPVLAAAVLMYGRPGRRIRHEFRRAFGREGVFRGYPDLFEALGGADLEAPLLRRLDADGPDGARTAAAAMSRLHVLMRRAAVRYSGWMHLPLQLLALWDAHVMARLQAWRHEHGRHARAWFDAAGATEALCALATLAHDHPDWCYAELRIDGVARFDAASLGHPLLDPAARVDNDVEVGPPATFLLVTGSNMSGKSTLLRAIGLNTVLALAGAPACARRLALPIVDLRTSIRIEDSLARGVSLFMAELERLRSIVAAASRGAGAPVLFLLDEVLHGTNTAERRIAAVRVISHLLDAGAIGAVTTHDLELGEQPPLQAAARPVHFTETVRPAETAAPLVFDYTLRPGVATSTNALKLLHYVGLD